MCYLCCAKVSASRERTSQYMAFWNDNEEELIKAGYVKEKFAHFIEFTFDYNHFEYSDNKSLFAALYWLQDSHSV